MENGDPDITVSRQQQIQRSYRTAVSRHSTQRSTWVVWLLTVVTVVLWSITAYQAAIAVGAHTLRDILVNIASNAINVREQDTDALSNVLISYGAKENVLMQHGQYWRFATPIFLHANLLHVGLNMLNFVVLGIFLERLVGHVRFLLIYLITGIISIIASFYFAPQEISVGASGAIFGLVGAYSIFVLVHRQAFPRGGIPALLWLILVIGINLGLGFIIPNVDNYAHVGGLVSGCLLGWWFTPLYTETKTSKILLIQQKTTVSQSAYPTRLAHTLVDTHSLARRWPLALLTILGTLALAVLALHLTGG
ncbi:MAG: hypothetical protein PVS3B3_06450 [Ktedonobacteraceae bacterium]